MLGSTDLEKLEERWATECCIEFSLATLDDINELKEFMLCNFYPDEPMSRCLGVAKGNGLIDKYVRYLLNKILIVDPIQKNNTNIPCSIIGRSTENNCIVGCRIGAIYSKQDDLPSVACVSNWLGELPLFLEVPRKFIDFVNQQSLFADLHYSKQDAFNELIESGNLIYFAECLVVSSTTRGIGLGAELLKRGYKLAKDAGCRYTYVLATSMYSQNIFHKLGNVKVLHEVKYEDYKYDKRGRAFLLDTGVHKVIQVLAIDHGM